MNDHDGKENVFADLDDTLADGPAPADVPDEARDWLAEQRMVHGLLRALHTADASSREGRIASILERIDHDERVGYRRRWFAVAAAALVLASTGVWLALPESLPTAEAAMLRTVDALGRDVDRRFRLEVIGHSWKGDEVVHHEFDLVTRPGMRFLIDGTFSFGGVRVGRARVGCDGDELWVLPVDESNRVAGPLAERERLLKGLGDVLDVGYLDLHELVKKVPDDCDVRVVGRETGPDGRERLRIEAQQKRTLFVKTRRATLWVDEASGMVTHLDAEVRFLGGAVRRLVIDYAGESPAGSVDYRRPW